VPDDPLSLERFKKWRGEVVEVDGEHADARVGLARLEAAIERRQRHQRIPQPYGHHLPRSRGLGDELAGFPIGGERQERLDLGVPGETLRSRRIDRAPRVIELVSPLLGGPQALGHAVGVAEEEVGGIDENAALFLGFDFESTLGRTGHCPVAFSA